MNAIGRITSKNSDFDTHRWGRHTSVRDVLKCCSQSPNGDVYILCLLLRKSRVQVALPVIQSVWVFQGKPAKISTHKYLEYFVGLNSVPSGLPHRQTGQDITEKTKIGNLLERSTSYMNSWK